MKFFSLLFAFIACIIAFASPLHAQETTNNLIEGKVLEIQEQELRENDDGTSQTYQKVLIEITKGERSGQTFTIEHGIFPTAKDITYSAGNRVVLQKITLADGQESYFIVDRIRRPALLWLFVLFIVLVSVIGGLRGAASLLGMAVSFVVILFFMLPQILAGSSPVAIALSSALIIVPITFYLSHGFNPKTHIAIIATMLTLSLIGLLSSFTIQAAHLTGFASEEAGFLDIQIGGTIQMQGLLLAGIIIGTLGILDDITVSQVSITNQLKSANKSFSFGELYRRAMNVGRDHISSLVNTLILVYTGASLPLLLLFVNNPRPFLEIVNYEYIADEIIRMLIGSIGLVLAVPIATVFAAFVYSREYIPSSKEAQHKRSK